MKQEIHPDDYFPLDWVPPSNWEFGRCRDCNRWFEPRLPKQYFCEPCRARAIHETSCQQAPVKTHGPISRMCTRKKTNMARVAKATGLCASVIQRWNKGGSPGDYRQAERLASYLNCRLDQLFDERQIKKMGNNPKWRN